MRVTIYSTMEGYPWGGSEELWYNVAKELIHNGCKIQVCVKNWPKKSPKLLELAEMGAQIVFRDKSNLTDRLKRKMNVEYVPKFIAQIKKFQPQHTLISQGATFDFFQNKALYDYIITSTIKYSLISQFNFENGGILDERSKQRLQASKNWENFYFVSNRNLENAVRQSATIIPNTSIVDNPVNIHNPGIANWPKTDILHLACVARYSCDFKGQDILLEALGDHIFRDISFKLNFYGEGEHKFHLKQLINLYGLQNKVTVNDSSKNIDEIWENHHLLVLPSLAEGTPLSLQEAMYKGRSALVCDVGDCAYLIDKSNGFILPYANKILLKNELLKIMKLPLENLRSLGENAYNLISKKKKLNSHILIAKNIIDTNE